MSAMFSAARAMPTMLRSILLAFLLAAASLLALTPRQAHAFCINCGQTSWVNVLEYVNDINGHYLLLPAGDPETVAVDNGAAGAGWQRTGNEFTTSISAPSPVCRFYSPVANTHFYTADPAECAVVKQSPDWVYEKSPFAAFPPSSGSCGHMTPIYRVYHAGDHRYIADAGLRDAMLAKGWIDEGIGFCVSGAAREPVKTMTAFPARIDSTHGCVASAGDCIALDSLPAMPNRVAPYLPPFYVTVNPAFPAGVSAIVGHDFQSDLYTSQPADASAIAQHSFASLTGAAYINGRDRVGGDLAAISTMVELPGVAGSTADQRVFVWRGASDRELRVSAAASVGVVSRDEPGSQAYGLPLIQFGDARSGHSFLVTIQAYGTVPPGDFVGADPRTGEPIVSTVFRPNPLFGSVLSGSFIACRGDGSPCAPQVSGQQPVPFVFSMKRADFQAALDRARAVDPALSAEPSSYFLARVAFHNETYLDARIGATVSGLTAQIWYVE